MTAKGINKTDFNMKLKWNSHQADEIKISFQLLSERFMLKLPLLMKFVSLFSLRTVTKLTQD